MVARRQGSELSQWACSTAYADGGILRGGISVRISAGNSTFEAGVFKVQAAQVFGKVKAQDVFDNLPSMGDEDGEYLDVGGSSQPKYELMLDSNAAEPEQDAKLAAQQSVKSQGLFDELPVSMPNIPSSEELIADHTPSSEGSQGSLIPALPEVHIKSVDDNDGGGGGEVNTQQSVKTQDTLDNLPDLDGYGEYMDVGGSSKPKYELMLDSDAAVPDQDKELDQQSVKTQDTFDNLPDLDGYGEYLEIGGSSKPKYELMLDSDAAVPDQDKELDQQSVNTQGMEGLRDMVQKYIHINDTGSDVEEEDNAELQVTVSSQFHVAMLRNSKLMRNSWCSRGEIFVCCRSRASTTRVTMATAWR